MDLFYTEFPLGLVGRVMNSYPKSKQLYRDKNLAKKSIPQLVKLATKWFNYYIRLRDTDEHGYGGCISSGRGLRLGDPNCQAGHYFPAGSSPWLAYHEDNVHLQSLSDNYYKSGDILRYRRALVKKIGEDRVKELEYIDGYFKNHGFKWDRFRLMEIIQTYRQKCAALEKLKMI